MDQAGPRRNPAIVSTTHSTSPSSSSAAIAGAAGGGTANGADARRCSNRRHGAGARAPHVGHAPPARALSRPALAAVPGQCGGAAVASEGFGAALAASPCHRVPALREVRLIRHKHIGLGRLSGDDAWGGGGGGGAFKAAPGAARQNDRESGLVKLRAAGDGLGGTFERQR